MSASWYHQASVPCLCLVDNDEQHPYAESSCTKHSLTAMSDNMNSSDFSWISDNFTTFEDFSHFYDNHHQHHLHQAVPDVLTAVAQTKNNTFDLKDISQDKKRRQRNRRNDKKVDDRVEKICNTRNAGKKGKERANCEEEDATVSRDGCVYVRARRGEAIDSHSLAERVRRQKISDKMKLLQSLVPGCDKKAGKILILDKIIDYIHSLHDQMKSLMEELALVDPTFNINYLALESSLIQTQKSYATSAGPECTRITSHYQPPWLALLEERDYTI